MERLEGVSKIIRERNGEPWRNDDGDFWPNWIDITPQGGNNRRPNDPDGWRPEPRPRPEFSDPKRGGSLADKIEENMDVIEDYREEYGGPPVLPLDSDSTYHPDIMKALADPANRAKMGVPEPSAAERASIDNASVNRFAGYGFVNGEPVAIYLTNEPGPLAVTDRGDYLDGDAFVESTGRFNRFMEEHNAVDMRSQAALITDLFEKR